MIFVKAGSRMVVNRIENNAVNQVAVFDAQNDTCNSRLELKNNVIHISGESDTEMNFDHEDFDLFLNAEERLEIVGTPCFSPGTPVLMDDNSCDSAIKNYSKNQGLPPRFFMNPPHPAEWKSKSFYKNQLIIAGTQAVGVVSMKDNHDDTPSEEYAPVADFTQGALTTAVEVIPTEDDLIVIGHNSHQESVWIKIDNWKERFTKTKDPDFLQPYLTELDRRSRLREQILKNRKARGRSKLLQSYFEDNEKK